MEVLSPDGVVQSLGFSFDLFQKLADSEGQGGELTEGRGLRFDAVKQRRGQADPGMAKRKSEEKRWVIGSDDRTEITNTWLYPYSAVGQVGTGCTGL